MKSVLNWFLYPELMELGQTIGTQFWDMQLATLEEGILFLAKYIMIFMLDNASTEVVYMML